MDLKSIEIEKIKNVFRFTQIKRPTTAAGHQLDLIEEGKQTHEAVQNGCRLPVYGLRSE